MFPPPVMFPLVSAAPVAAPVVPEVSVLAVFAVLAVLPPLAQPVVNPGQTINVVNNITDVVVKPALQKGGNDALILNQASLEGTGKQTELVSTGTESSPIVVSLGDSPRGSSIVVECEERLGHNSPLAMNDIGMRLPPGLSDSSSTCSSQDGKK